ncbi:MAG TPA: hypothetical protein VH476_10020 [Solirubrobacterales bacterium]
MSSITTWNRIEPRTRDASLPGLEARVADPLWLLGRQWQAAEFQAEDAGSPAVVRLQADVGRISRFAPGSPPSAVTGEAYDPSGQPLETVVEREPALAAGERNARLAAESGLAFWRRLDEVGLAHRREDYLLDWGLERPTREARAALDGATARIVETLAERVPDGIALRDAILEVRAEGGDLPAEPRFDDPAERKLARRAADAFLTWWDALDAGADSVAGESTWAPDRLEYRFSVSGMLDGKELVMRAAEYRGDGVDWSTFDLESGAGASLMAGGADPDSTRLEKSTIPAPATYRGMPAPRWWEFEDAEVHYGAADAGKEDLARMLFMEFALVYGNDFFVIPVELELGAICQIDRLEVLDAFGGLWSIPSVEQADGAGGQFHMFRLEGATAARSPFVLAPSPAASLSGEALEEVAFGRDEMANMAWAVERVVVGPAGRPIRRIESEKELRQRELQAEIEAGTAENRRSDEPLRYRIVEQPPASWLPLVPVKSGVDQIELEVRTLPDAQEPPRPLLPQGRIVRVGDLIREEEVPRRGLTLTRSYQYVRWQNGESLLWIGRDRRLGQDEGTSGLRYDVAE